MRSDISPAKKYANWDTVLVLEEMEAELDDYCDISDSSNDRSGPTLKRQRTIVIVAVLWFCVCYKFSDYPLTYSCQ